MEEKIGQFHSWVQKNPGKRGQVGAADGRAGAARQAAAHAALSSEGAGLGAIHGPALLHCTAERVDFAGCGAPLVSTNCTATARRCPPRSAGLPLFLRETAAPELVQVGSTKLDMLEAKQPSALPGMVWPHRCARLWASPAAEGLPPGCAHACTSASLAASICQPSGTPPSWHAIPWACSTSEERFYWEQWLVDIQVLGPAPAEFEEQQAFAASSLRAQRRQRAQTAIEECLTAVVRHGGCCTKCWGRGGGGSGVCRCPDGFRCHSARQSQYDCAWRAMRSPDVWPLRVRLSACCQHCSRPAHELFPAPAHGARCSEREARPHPSSGVGIRCHLPLCHHRRRVRAGAPRAAFTTGRLAAAAGREQGSAACCVPACATGAPCACGKPTDGSPCAPAFLAAGTAALALAWTLSGACCSTPTRPLCCTEALCGHPAAPPLLQRWLLARSSGCALAAAGTALSGALAWQPRATERHSSSVGYAPAR